MFDNKTKFSAPVILDLTESGSIILTREGLLIEGGSYCFDPYVRIPGKNQWEKVENIHFNLQRVKGKYKLSVRKLFRQLDQIERVLGDVETQQT